MNIGEKLKHELSSGRESTFAQVDATSVQIAAAEARKGNADTKPNSANPATLQATMVIPMSIEGNINQGLREAMATIGKASGIPLEM